MESGIKARDGTPACEGRNFNNFGKYTFISKRHLSCQISSLRVHLIINRDWQHINLWSEVMTQHVNIVTVLTLSDGVFFYTVKAKTQTVPGMWDSECFTSQLEQLTQHRISEYMRRRFSLVKVNINFWKNSSAGNSVKSTNSTFCHLNMKNNQQLTQKSESYVWEGFMLSFVLHLIEQTS